MTWESVFATIGSRVATREHLLAAGASPRSLTAGTRAGHLVRARRDRYLLPSEPLPVLRSVRLGGRLACVSALRERGVFADCSGLHVHLERDASRLRSPDARGIPLGVHRGDAVTHWSPLSDPAAADSASVGVLDALIQASSCQPPWVALASIENALHHRLITAREARLVFARAPRRVAELEPLLDPRAEAGQETVLRMIVVHAGLRCEVQVRFSGIGRVDLVVEDCLALEADSRLSHSGWEQQVRDRERDLALARVGIMSLRPVYQHTMHTPDAVLASIVGLLAQHRRFAPQP